jgi:hypothetical protein
LWAHVGRDWLMGKVERERKDENSEKNKEKIEYSAPHNV